MSFTPPRSEFGSDDSHNLGELSFDREFMREMDCICGTNSYHYADDIFKTFDDELETTEYLPDPNIRTEYDMYSSSTPRNNAGSSWQTTRSNIRYLLNTPETATNDNFIIEQSSKTKEKLEIYNLACTVLEEKLLNKNMKSLDGGSRSYSETMFLNSSIEEEEEREKDEEEEEEEEEKEEETEKVVVTIAQPTVLSTFADANNHKTKQQSQIVSTTNNGKTNKRSRKIKKDQCKDKRTSPSLDQTTVKLVDKKPKSTRKTKPPRQRISDKRFKKLFDNTEMKIILKELKNYETKHCLNHIMGNIDFEKTLTKICSKIQLIKKYTPPRTPEDIKKKLHDIRKNYFLTQMSVLNLKAHSEFMAYTYNQESKKLKSTSATPSKTAAQHETELIKKRNNLMKSKDIYAMLCELGAFWEAMELDMRRSSIKSHWDFVHNKVVHSTENKFS